MIKLEYTEQQVSGLLGLLDLATKSGGLQVAETALFFVKSIDAALKASKQVTPPQQASATEAESPAA